MLLYVAAMPTEGIVGEGGKDKVEVGLVDGNGGRAEMGVGPMGMIAGRDSRRAGAVAEDPPDAPSPPGRAFLPIHT